MHNVAVAEKTPTSSATEMSDKCSHSTLPRPIHHIGTRSSCMRIQWINKIAVHHSSAKKRSSTYNPMQIGKICQQKRHSITSI
eukprot:scaffold2577_cov127-Skeletonema_menzelii.AAC.2